MAIPVAGMAKMAGSAVGQVGIQLALEKAFFNKDVANTTKQTESAFSKTFGRVGKLSKSAFNGMSSGVSKVKGHFQRDFGVIGSIIQTTFAVVGVGAVTQFAKSSIELASETQSAWTGLYSIVNGTGKSFVNAKKFLEEYTKDGLIPLTNAITSYKNLASRGYEQEQIEGIMLALKDASAFGRQASYSYGEAIQSATEGLKNENSILVDNAGVTKNVAKMWEEYADAIGTTANNLTLAQKRQAEYLGIMEETKFQMGDAKVYADTYAGQVAKLSTAFFNLKVTVGQVLAPVLAKIIPAITSVVNGLTKLFNKLKSIMATFGFEWKEYYTKDTSTAIDKATESANGLSSGLDGAGSSAIKNAKKIKKAFAGVDEINVLNMPDSSKNSGGGSGSDLGDIGAGTDNSLNEDLEDTAEEMTQNLGFINKSFYDWGVSVGENINKGLRMIPWDSIQSTMIGISSRVAEFLNGAVAGLDWTLLGRTLGEGFNTALYTLNTFYATFDWKGLGKGLGNGINGIFYSVDWEVLGEFLGRKFSSTFQILSSMFDNMNWKEIGTSVGTSLQNFIDHIDFDAVADTFSNGINGVFTAVGNFITSVNWGDFGFDIGSSISKFLEDTDWIKVGQTISDGVRSALRFVLEFIKGIDWVEVGQTIGNLLASIDWLKIAKDLAMIIWNALWGIGGMLLGVVVGIGESIVKGIWQGIKNFLGDPLGWLKKNLVDPIIQRVKDLFGIHSPSTVFAGIGKNLIEGLWEGISKLKKWISDKWTSVKGWFSDITKQAKVEIKQKWNDIKEKWENLTKNIKDKTADMKAKVATTWSNIKSKWTSITNNIKDKTASMKAKIGTTWSQLRSKWNSLMSNFKDKTITIKTKIGEVVGNLKQTINDKVIKKINSKLPSIFPKIPYLAQGGWFAKNNPTLAVVGDNKHEPEITAPESKIYDQTRKAVEDVGATNTSQHFDFTIKLEYPDGKYLIKEINEAQIRDGRLSLLV